MLNWYICKDNDFVWEGYDNNNNLLYKISYIGYAVGWCWEDILHQKGGECYDTEEEAMAAVEKHYTERLKQEAIKQNEGRKLPSFMLQHFSTLKH